MKKIIVLEHNKKLVDLYKDLFKDDKYFDSFDFIFVDNGVDLELEIDKNKDNVACIITALYTCDFYPADFFKKYRDVYKILVVSATLEFYKGYDSNWAVKKPFDNNYLVKMVKERLETDL